jgi:aspartyl-tRNA(Asn)/glutamyl-tRNA(Gln) amidotransferase subunit A
MTREEGFGDEVKRRILLGTFVLSSGYQEAYYKKAQKVRQLIINKFEEAFSSCDLVAMPVATGGAFAFGAKKDPLSMYLEDIYTVGANLAGLPAISLPSGRLADGRPFGFQLMAPQRHDAELLSVGRAFQIQTTYHNERPTIEGGDR